MENLMRQATGNTFAKSMAFCLSSAAILAGCGGADDKGTADSQASASNGRAKAMAADSCNSVTWAAGQFYSLGTVVRYAPNGGFYKLVNVGPNGSDGTDPTISTWYWSPTSCSADPGPGPGPGTCATWAPGNFYGLGTVVRYAANGNYYKVVNVGSNGSDGTDPTISTWYWSPTSSCGTDPGPGPGPGPGGFVVSQDQFNQMFPGRGSFYTYNGLVGALAAYPAFANSGSDTVKKQEAAAFLANINHETGGLVYVDEINTAVYHTYCHPELPYGCPAGVTAYHGRGPIQLSHNYNYKTAGDALGLDLLNHPEWVSNNPEISWKTGIWFWMNSTGAVGTTPHNAMVGGSGFGTTIRVINGGLECNGANPAQVQARVDAYQRFTQILGVPAGGNLGC